MGKSRSRKYQEQCTWKAFADYIKTRDAIRTTGTLSEVVCHFCGRRLLRGESQAGHVISRSYGNALYNPQVVFASCVTCNHKYEGNHVLGFFGMVDLVGDIDVAMRMVVNATRGRSFTMEELEDIEEGCEYALEMMEQYYEEHAK